MLAATKIAIVIYLIWLGSREYAMTNAGTRQIRTTDMVFGRAFIVLSSLRGFMVVPYYSPSMLAIAFLFTMEFNKDVFSNADCASIP